MKLANYNRSLLSLVSSVLNYYGYKTEHQTLPEMDKLLKKDYKNVVVMLFDGMGDAIIKRNLNSQSFFSRNQRGVISSVFPPTTTAATTTMVSGLSPIEHGWLGWTLHFEDINKNVCLFPNIEYLTDEKAAEFDVATKYLGYKSVFEKIEEGSCGRVKASNVSAYSDFKADSVDRICDIVQELCEDEQRRYIYTYYKNPDFKMHEYGVGHEIVRKEMEYIECKVNELCDKLNDTLVIVTADHGLIDIEWKNLRDYPDIWDCLSDVPTVEARALTFFVKEGREEEFENAFNKHFSNDYELMTKERALSFGIFGNGTPHPMVDRVLGEYIAVALGKTTINVSDKPPFFVATHAGTTPEEYDVPFIVIEKK